MFSNISKKGVGLSHIDLLIVMNIMLVPDLIEIGFEILLVLLTLEFLEVLERLGTCHVSLILGNYFDSAITVLGKLNEETLNEFIILRCVQLLGSDSSDSEFLLRVELG